MTAFAIPALAFVAVTQVAQAAIDVDRFLLCIAQVEGHHETDLGGRYGLTSAVWHDNTARSYALSRIPAYAEPVARRHLQWLQRTLAARGFPVTPYTLGSSWRWGLEGFALRQRHARVEYGERVENLYYSVR